MVENKDKSEKYNSLEMFKKSMHLLFVPSSFYKITRSDLKNASLEKKLIGNVIVFSVESFRIVYYAYITYSFFNVNF